MVQNHHEILVSLCSKNSTVSYDLLMSALGIGTERELEDFIIQAIYQDIIQGRLNPVRRALEVTDWSAARLSDSDLQFMTDTLMHWGKHCNEFVDKLAKEVDSSNARVAKFANREREISEQMDNIRKTLNTEESRKFWSGNAMERDAWGSGQQAGSKLGSHQKPETKRFKSGLTKKRGGSGGGN